MKRALTLIGLLAGTQIGYSQGAINFNAYNAGFKQAIYNTGFDGGFDNYTVIYNGYSVIETLGSSTQFHETPTGTTIYTGGGLSGSGYSAELLIGPAGITTTDGTVNGVGLLPFGGTGNNGVIAGFHTGAQNIGFINSTASVVLPDEPYYAVGDSVSVAIAAWNNEGGTVNSLAAAQAMNLAIPNFDPWGISNVAQSGPLAAPPYVPVALPATLESFSLGFVNDGYMLPEPGTMSLCIIGASTCLFRRRK